MFEGPVQRLIDELARLPGVGRKTAQRLAFHLLTVDEAEAKPLSAAIAAMRRSSAADITCSGARCPRSMVSGRISSGWPS